MIKAYYKWLFAHKLFVIVGALVLLIGFSVASGSSKTSQTTKPTAKPPVARVKPMPAVKPAPAGPISDADKAKVVAILSDNDKHYADIFKQGQNILGTTQYSDGQAGLTAMEDPNSAASQYSAYQKNPNPCSDFSSNDAFKKADAYYNADNETNGIRSWQTDTSQFSSDLCQWVNKGVSWQISEITTAQLQTYADKVSQDLATLSKDVTYVQSNK
jgi:predicted 3-demethylubiquinone-9 3-methyltransferase (glyoxalase superfamily)